MGGRSHEACSLKAERSSIPLHTHTLMHIQEEMVLVGMDYYVQASKRNIIQGILPMTANKVSHIIFKVTSAIATKPELTVCMHSMC